MTRTTDQHFDRFDPLAYFTGLRTVGAQPYSLNGDSYGFTIVDNSVAGHFHEWAHVSDPDMALRKDFVRSAWASRDESERVLYLG